VQTFVVRVYRRGARRLAGVLEDVEGGACRAFRSVRELTQMLRAAPPKAGKKHTTNAIDRGDKS
jgi:hypothetical protein